MSTCIREHLRSNVIGYVALFFALTGGVAWATHPGGANTISSGDILNGEVKSADVGDGEVRNPDLAADAVASGKIQDRQVKNADLSLGASSSNTIADGGIQGVDVKNDTLDGNHVANDSLTGNDVDEASLDPSSFFATANAGAGGVTCTADAGAQECANTNINLPRDSRLMIVASGQWYVFSFDDGTLPDEATGVCEVQVDDVSTDSSHAMGERRTAAGANSWTQTPGAGFARGTLALTHLTGVLAAGNHKLDVTCDEVDDDIDWANVRLVAARVG